MVVDSEEVQEVVVDSEAEGAEVAEVAVDSGVKRSKNSRYVHLLKYNLSGKIIKHYTDNCFP